MARSPQVCARCHRSEPKIRFEISERTGEQNKCCAACSRRKRETRARKKPLAAPVPKAEYGLGQSYQPSGWAITEPGSCWGVRLEAR